MASPWSSHEPPNGRVPVPQRYQPPPQEQRGVGVLADCTAKQGVGADGIHCARPSGESFCGGGVDFGRVFEVTEGHPLLANCSVVRLMPTPLGKV